MAIVGTKTAIIRFMCLKNSGFMRICVPVIGKDSALSNLMANDFYQAGYYQIYDSVSRESQLFPKAVLMEKFGAGLTGRDDDNRIEVIITPNMRAMAYKILADHHIRVYRSEGHQIDVNLRLFEEDRLSVFDPFQVECTAAGCHGSSCGSCSSTGCR